MASLVPRVLKRVCQNLLVNLASLSDTMDWGRPCNRKMQSKKSLAVSGAVAVVLVGAKCTILEKVSTKTTMASCPALLLGSWVMKSMCNVTGLRGGFEDGFLSYISRGDQ